MANSIVQFVNVDTIIRFFNNFFMVSKVDQQLMHMSFLSLFGDRVLCGICKYDLRGE